MHRQLIAVLEGKKPRAKHDELVVLAQHCTRTERRAEAAERELIRVKLLSYLEDQVGKAFHAIIVGVEDFGLFCRLSELPVEGLIHVTSLADDYYYLEVGNAHPGRPPFRPPPPAGRSRDRADRPRRRRPARAGPRPGGLTRFTGKTSRPAGPSSGRMPDRPSTAKTGRRRPVRRPRSTRTHSDEKAQEEKGTAKVKKSAKKKSAKPRSPQSARDTAKSRISGRQANLTVAVGIKSSDRSVKTKSTAQVQLASSALVRRHGTASIARIVSALGSSNNSIPSQSSSLSTKKNQREQQSHVPSNCDGCSSSGWCRLSGTWQVGQHSELVQEFVLTARATNSKFNGIDCDDFEMGRLHRFLPVFLGIKEQIDEETAHEA